MGDGPTPSFVTMLFRSSAYKKTIIESYNYYYEYFLLYVAGAKEEKIGFINQHLYTLINTEHFRTFQKGEELFEDVRKDFDVLKLWLIDQYRNAIHQYPETSPLLESLEVQEGIFSELVKRHQWTGRFISFNEYCFIYGNLPLVPHRNILSKIFCYNWKRVVEKTLNRLYWLIEVLSFRKLKIL